MHTRRESKMSAQGNACTELIADAESLSNVIHQQRKIENEFYVATHRKSCRIQSTMKFLRDSYGNEWQCEDGVSRLNSLSTLQMTMLQFLLRISLPSALTEKKQQGNKPCLFLTNPSSHSISSGTPQIWDPLLSVIPWEKWLLPCPSHLCCFTFLSFFAHQELKLHLVQRCCQLKCYLSDWKHSPSRRDLPSDTLCRGAVMWVAGFSQALSSQPCCCAFLSISPDAGCYFSWITNSSSGTAPGLSLLQPTHGQCSATAPLLFEWFYIPVSLCLSYLRFKTASQGTDIHVQVFEESCCPMETLNVFKKGNGQNWVLISAMP